MSKIFSVLPSTESSTSFSVRQHVQSFHNLKYFRSIVFVYLLSRGMRSVLASRFVWLPAPRRKRHLILLETRFCVSVNDESRQKFRATRAHAFNISKSRMRLFAVVSSGVFGARKAERAKQDEAEDQAKIRATWHWTHGPTSRAHTRPEDPPFLLASFALCAAVPVSFTFVPTDAVPPFFHRFFRALAYRCPPQFFHHRDLGVGERSNWEC